MKTRLNRKKWTMMAVLACFMALAGPAEASEHKWVEKTFRDSMDVSVKAIKHMSFSGVFQKTIYDVEYTMFADNKGFSPGSDYRVFTGDDRLIPIVKPGTDMKLAYFDALINPEFKLNGDTAEDFRAALKALFGDRFFDKVDGKSIRKVDGNWQFLTGTFFDHLKGFVVSVDADGRITAVHYKLKL